MKISVKAMQCVETIPGCASSDRLYVNSSFRLFFSDKYINKKIKKCSKNGTGVSTLREGVLKMIRESDRHQTLKGKFQNIFCFRYNHSNFFAQLEMN